MDFATRADFDKLFSVPGALMNFKCRLLEEGNNRWVEFQGHVSRMVEQGVSLDEAIKLAQRAFKPLPVSPFTPPAFPKPVAEVPEEEKPKGPAPWRKVIQWVFENMESVQVEPESAPSPGAFGLLIWAKPSPTNTTTFYANIWPKVLPTKQEIDAIHGREEETDDAQIGELGRMLDEIDAALVAENEMARTGSAWIPPELSLAEEDSREG